MASLNAAKLAAFSTLCAAKTCGKTRLVQYVITAKSPLKTGIDSLQVILLNFKKHIPQEFCLPALQPAVRLTSSRCMGLFFVTLQVITV